MRPVVATSTISAVGQGEPGNAVLTVAGSPSGTPTTPFFSGQPSTTTAGQALPPAVEGDGRKLYDLVWKRTVASQMASARLEQTTLDIASD